MTTLRGTNRFKRCPKCKAILRRSAEVCPHCTTTMPSNFPHRPLTADTRQWLRAITEEVAPTVKRPDIEPQYLIITARDRRDLYDYFRRVFGREPAVLVMMERRTAERRAGSATRPLERRRKDRRRRSEIDADIRRLGFAIARLD